MPVSGSLVCPIPRMRRGRSSHASLITGTTDPPPSPLHRSPVVLGDMIAFETCQNLIRQGTLSMAALQYDCIPGVHTGSEKSESPVYLVSIITADRH